MGIDAEHFQTAIRAFQQAIGYEVVAAQHQGDWLNAPSSVSNAARQKRASAIRGEKHVRPIYDYCTKELLARGFKRSNVFPQQEGGRRKTTVHGGFFEKEVDAGVSLEHSGPLLIISVKTMLTASRNLKNRIEEAIADAANLHTRYPMLCFGFLMLVPARLETEKDVAALQEGRKSRQRRWVDEPVIKQDGKPTPLGENLLRYITQLQPREDITETPGRYEAVALAVVDFDHDPPTLIDQVPPQDSPVRLERFFDVLHERFIVLSAHLVFSFDEFWRECKLGGRGAARNHRAARGNRTLRRGAREIVVANFF